MTNKPRITAESLLLAAWSQRQAGLLPLPPTLVIRNVVEAGAMRPWLRQAIGTREAIALETSGRGGWWLGALLGRNMSGTAARSEAFLEFDPGEENALMALDDCCAFADTRYALTCIDSVRHCGWTEIGPFLDRAEVRVRRAQSGATRTGEAAPRRDRRVTRAFVGLFLREAARVLDVDLSGAGEAMTVGEAVEDVVVASLHPCEAGTEYLLRASDGHGWRWFDRRGFGDGNLRVGERAELRLRGVMPGFRGYASSLRSPVVGASREIPNDPSDVDGTSLAEGDVVTLLHDCLEAPRHAAGAVVETMGDMAVVSFVGVDDPVPCYAKSLRRAA